MLAVYCDNDCKGALDSFKEICASISKHHCKSMISDKNCSMMKFSLVRKNFYIFSQKKAVFKENEIFEIYFLKIISMKAKTLMNIQESGKRSELIRLKYLQVEISITSDTT